MNNKQTKVIDKVHFNISVNVSLLDFDIVLSQRVESKYHNVL